MGHDMGDGISETMGRPVEYLRLSLTDRCNMRCQYCMPAAGADLLPADHILRYEELTRLVGLLARLGIRKVRLTGGEPLVRKGVVDFIRKLTAVEGVSEVTLTTNGSLLAPMAEDLFRAGLKRINISLDSLQPERFRQITGRDWYDRVWEGIREAERVGFSPIKLNVVVMGGINDREIPGFVELARKRPYQVRFIEYMPIGRESRWSRARFVDTAATLEKVRGLARLIPAARQGLDGPARSYHIEGAKGGVGFISPLSDHFCSLCNRLRLTPQGHLRTCLFSDRETDLRGLLRSGADDAELSAVMTAALESKRSGNYGLKPGGGCTRPMYHIGG